MRLFGFFTLNKIVLLGLCAGIVWWFLPTWMPDSFGLPAQLKLTNKENKTIKAVVTGRSDEHFRFMRVDTNERFSYNLSDLRLDSRLRLLRYPTSIEAQPARPDLRSMHREGLVQERQRLQARIAQLQGESTSSQFAADGDTMKVSLSAGERGRMREIERINQRIQELNSRIAAFSD